MEMPFAAARESENGTFETCPPILRMSVDRGRLEVTMVRPNRRDADRELGPPPLI